MGMWGEELKPSSESSLGCHKMNSSRFIRFIGYHLPRPGVKQGVHINIFIPLLHQSHHWAGEQRMPAFLFLGMDLGGFILNSTAVFDGFIMVP